MESRKPYLATLPGLIPGCLVCCALWGSAFPASRSATHSLASQRTIALRSCSLQVCALRLPAPVIVGMSAAQRRPSFRKRATSSPSLSCRSSRLSGSTSFFYLGLSRASAMSSSIIEASANFLAILFAAPGISHREAQYGQGAWLCAGLCRRRARQPFGRGRHLGLRSTARALSWASHCCRRPIDLPDRHLLARARRRLACRVAVLVGGVVLTAIGFLMGGTLSPHRNRPRHRAHHLYGTHFRRRVLAVVAPACRQPRQPRLGLWVYEPRLWCGAERAAARRGLARAPLPSSLPCCWSAAASSSSTNQKA